MRIVLKVQRVLPAALLLLPMLTGALWLVSLPPAHGPDEEAHLEYIELLAVEREFPTLRFVPGGGMSEGHQPPLYYMTAAISSSLLGLGWGMRWLSLLMGAGSILAYYGIALKLLPDRNLEAALMAATVGLLPMFSFLTATVNNGAMVQLMVALVLYLGVEPRKWQGARSLWMGALVAGAVLSKMSGLFLIPYLILAWGRLYGEGKLSLQGFLSISGRLLLVITFVAGWWFWRNWLLYGDPFGWEQQMAAAQALVRRERLSPEYMYAVTVELWRSFWAAFGPSARQTASPSIYILISVIIAPGVAGLVASRWTTLSGRIVGALLGGWVVAFLGWPLAVPWFSSRIPLAGGFAAKSLLTLLVAWILWPIVKRIRWVLPQGARRETGLLGLASVLLLIGVYRYNVDFPQPQGRFLMPCAAPLLFLVTLGWMAFFGWKRRWIPLTGGLILAGIANFLALLHYAH